MHVRYLAWGMLVVVVVLGLSEFSVRVSKSQFVRPSEGVGGSSVGGSPSGSGVAPSVQVERKPNLKKPSGPCTGRVQGVSPIWLPSTLDPPIGRTRPNPFFHNDLDAILAKNIYPTKEERDKVGVFKDKMFFSHGETFDPSPYAKVPWVSQDQEANSVYTEYAQRVIFANQHPPDCSKANFLVHKSTEYGIGSDLYFAAVDLLHAVLLNRVFVWPGPWKWSPGPCEKMGLDCFFAAATNCTEKHLGRIVDRWPSTKIRQSKARSIRKTWWNTKDMRLIDAPATLMPPGEAKRWKAQHNYTGKGEYSHWANGQAVRFLLRAAQPWFAQIIHHELYTKLQFPWKIAPRVTAVHLRGGDARKEHEVWRTIGCRKVTLEGYVDIVQNVFGSHTVAATSDVDDILVNFKEKMGAWPTYLHTNFPKPNKEGLDSRDHGAMLFGKFYVSLVGFLDLFVGIAADSWVFYESNWSKLISRLKETVGRAYCPSVDVSSRVGHNATFREKYCDARKPTGWVDEGASPWGWITTPQRKDKK